MLIGPDTEDLPVVMDVEGETSRQLIRYTTGHLCTYIVEQNIFLFLQNLFDQNTVDLFLAHFIFIKLIAFHFWRRFHSSGLHWEFETLSVDCYRL